MGHFLDSLMLEHTGREEHGRAIYRIARKFRYRYGRRGCGGMVLVPAGFLTDLASVPWLLWHLASPQKGQQAAVVHDFLYQTNLLERSLADAIFRMALADAGVGPVRRWWMWAAVRLFGGRVFRSHTNAESKGEMQGTADGADRSAAGDQREGA